MRKHLGNDFPLMADANMKWTVEEAIRAARALNPNDLTWLEEPIIPDDIGRSRPHHGLPAACRSRPAKICARSGSSRTISRWRRVSYPEARTSPIAVA